MKTCICVTTYFTFFPKSGRRKKHLDRPSLPAGFGIGADLPFVQHSDSVRPWGGCLAYFCWIPEPKVWGKMRPRQQQHQIMSFVSEAGRLVIKWHPGVKILYFHKLLFIRCRYVAWEPSHTPATIGKSNCFTFYIHLQRLNMKHCLCS